MSEHEKNKARILAAVQESLKNDEKLIVVTEQQIYAMGTLRETERVLKSALKAFK